MCQVENKNVSSSQPLQLAKESKRDGLRAKIKSQTLASRVRSKSTSLNLRRFRQHLTDPLAGSPVAP